jgi:AraC-like DNA-binding protein
MLHSIPVSTPAAPCRTLGRRAARGSLAVGYSAFSGAGPVPHRLLPLNFPVLIVDFDLDLVLLSGPRDSSTLDGPTTWGRGISIGLTPGALPNISEICGQIGPVDLPWPEQLAALPSWAARFAWLDEAFRGPAEPSPITAAWWHLQRHPTTRVADLAADLDISRRRLERAFRREFGQSPGAVARVARLQRSLSSLLRGDPPATAALAGGYADQPHLTRAMRDMVGLTPAALRAFLQDVAPARPLPSGA